MVQISGGMDTRITDSSMGVRWMHKRRWFGVPRVIYALACSSVVTRVDVSVLWLRDSAHKLISLIRHSRGCLTPLGKIKKILSRLY